MARIDDVYEEADGMMTDWDWFINQPKYYQAEIMKGKIKDKKVSKKEYMERHAKKKQTDKSI